MVTQDIEKKVSRSIPLKKLIGRYAKVEEIPLSERQLAERQENYKEWEREHFDDLQVPPPEVLYPITYPWKAEVENFLNGEKATILISRSGLGWISHDCGGLCGDAVDFFGYMENMMIGAEVDREAVARRLIVEKELDVWED